MIEALLVPLDGSEQAELALPTAAAISAATDAAIHLVHVRTTAPVDAAADADWPDSYLERLQTEWSRPGRPVMTALLLEGLPPHAPPTAPHTVASLLTGYGQRNGAGLIVMTTHGRGGLGRMWFGSVADALLRTTTIPTLVVKPHHGAGAERASPRFRSVLVAIAPDDDASGLISAARRVLAGQDPSWTLLRVLPMPYTITGQVVPATVVFPGIDPVAETAAAEREFKRAAVAFDLPDAAVTTVFHPVPAQAILDFADDHGIDVIVVGTRGLRGLDRVVLGSVADKVVRRSTCPVLVVPRESPVEPASPLEAGSGAGPDSA